MANPKLLSIVLSLLLLGPAARASLSNVYIAQTPQGANSGATCANAYGSTFFNTAGNWGAGGSQIGPGTVVHVCGTWNGNPGSTLLTFNGAGAAGQVITLKFETGAVMQAPYFSTNGAINLNGKSHILIDGGPTCGIVNGSLIPCNGGPPLI